MKLKDTDYLLSVVLQPGIMNEKVGFVPLDGPIYDWAIVLKNGEDSVSPETWERARKAFKAILDEEDDL